MCGILGYIGNKNATPLLVRGLKRLEYRGYDSVGICLVSGQKLENCKSQGRISEFERKPELKNLEGNIGIGHVRWATHGAPSEINAHPHLDCKREIAIVHNGIIEKEIQELKWTIDQIEKKGFKHFMLKEISEQPQVLENTLRGRIKEGKIKLSVNIDSSSIKRIILTACGTSWHACLVGKHTIEKLTKIPVEVDYASEFRYRNPLLTPQDLVIVVSQSGETADTLGALKEAKLKGSKVFGIVNVVGSTISREVDSGVFLHAGPEIGVASTKDKTYDKILSNIEEVRARKGKIITLISREDKKIQELSDFIIKVPQTSELLSPILNVIPLQLLAYYIADFKNIDPDKPRNLAKSVTVE